jgi:hypothetical protein
MGAHQNNDDGIDEMMAQFAPRAPKKPSPGAAPYKSQNAQPPRPTSNQGPFDLATLRERCLASLRATATELTELSPAQRAVVAAYREMPILAEILAEGINQRYAEAHLIRGKADHDLLMAIHGCEAVYGMTLKYERNPEALALFEHSDFTEEIDRLPDGMRTQVRAHQQRWQREREERRAALDGQPPTP